MKSVTVFKRSNSAHGQCVAAHAKLPDGRVLAVMRMGAGGVLPDAWQGDDVMLGVTGQGMGSTLYLTAEQASALVAELLALAGGIPGAMPGGVQ